MTIKPASAQGELGDDEPDAVADGGYESFN